MAETMSRRPYVRGISRGGWYLRQPRYVRYMAREVSCVFIGGYTLILVVMLHRLAQGPAAYEAFLHTLRSWPSIMFHLLAMAFALYHATQWFNVAPKAMPIQRGEDFVPAGVVMAAHYGAWVAVSLAVLFLAGVFA